MNTLKKGDKCQSPWGVLTLNEDQSKGDFVAVTIESGEVKLMRTKELDRLLANAQPQTDMPIKKGDKCQSSWGVIEVDGFNGSYIDCIMSNGKRRWIDVSQLTRIPTHAERMQAVLDIAWDVENRLEDDETVQLKVGAFVEFARHYCLLREELEYEASLFEGEKAIMEVRQREITKSLKGEL